MKLPSWLLVVLVVLLGLVLFVDGTGVEGFEGTELLDDDVYDEHYVKFYDQLFDVPDRMQWEVGAISTESLSEWSPAESKLLVLFCATGNYLKMFAAAGAKSVVGQDPSPAFVDAARKRAPAAVVDVGDPMSSVSFPDESFTTVFIPFFGVYRRRPAVFANVYAWLKPGATLVVHAVDPARFDPILDAASPFPAFSPQKYSEERIVESEIVFDEFNYKSRFEMGKNDRAVWRETLDYGEGRKRGRKHKQTLWMPSVTDLVHEAKKAGLTLHKTVDMTVIHHEYQYLLFFKK